MTLGWSTVETGLGILEGAMAHGTPLCLRLLSFGPSSSILWPRVSGDSDEHLTENSDFPRWSAFRLRC